MADCITQAWKTNVSFLKPSNSKYVAKNSDSGSSREATLQKPSNFEELFQLECNYAQQSPPAIIDYGDEVVMGEEGEKPNTTSWFRDRTAQLQLLENCTDDQKDWLEQSMRVMEGSHQTREKLSVALIAFLKRN